MRTLIYKRTHCGDPNLAARVFGNHDCMGKVRRWRFDAVIGIGGIRPWPECKAIAAKLNWVGIGAHRIFDDPEVGEACYINGYSKQLRGPRVIFDVFWYCGGLGPSLKEKYPALASRMYAKNVSVLMHSPSPLGEPEVSKISDLDRDVEKILQLAGCQSLTPGSTWVTNICPVIDITPMQT